MQIHQEELQDVNKYINNYKRFSLEDFEPNYRSYMRAIEKYHPVDANTRILEIGTGIGWFPIRCKMNGWQCVGLEISQQLIDYAMQFGKQYGVEPEIRLGNIEEDDIGENSWDVVIASNVFEHVEYWEKALVKIHRGLKPGGILWFESSNKFCVRSHEFDMPFYGWLPDQARYALRRAVQGPDIMKLGIDFNQFRHGQLRRKFEQIGFSKIYDRIEMTEESWVSSDFRRRIVRMSRENGLVKSMALLFSDATRFVCVK